MAAAAFQNYTPGYPGTIYTSVDSGVTWRAGRAAVAPNDYWKSVTSSADGNKLVALFGAAGSASRIYIAQSVAAPLLSIEPGGGHFAISWIVPSTDFVLQQNSDLDITNWVDVTNTFALNLTNLNVEMIVPPQIGNRFYRLQH